MIITNKRFAFATALSCFLSLSRGQNEHLPLLRWLQILCTTIYVVHNIYYLLINIELKYTIHAG